MDFNWINQKNNNKLIVFLNGWAMNKNAVKDLETGDFDILEINDYRKIEKELDFDFSIFNFEI